MGDIESNLDELLFDLNNPRFDGLASQREALEKIVLSQGSKLVNLAEDIVTEGMSPAHRMLVLKAPGRGKPSHIVMDGNRRLAALRVLANPAVLDGMAAIGDLTAQKLRNLAADFEISKVEPVDVFVCRDAQQARHWIEAIHTGENDGRGVVGWDGIATARYRGKNTSLKVLEFVKAAGKLTAAELASLERFPITNLDRLLATPSCRQMLGVTLEDGDLLSDLPQTELLRSLKRIVSDLATKKIGVSALKGKDDREAYVKSLGALLPDLSKRTGAPESLERLAAHAQAKSHAKPSSTSKATSLLDRKALIPSQALCPLNIPNQKLQQICKELRKLPLDTYPVAIASTFRVFLELSLDNYGTTTKDKAYNVDLTLKKKLEWVVDHLIAAGASKKDLAGFRSLANSSHKALSIDRLHGIIHNRFALPTGAELRSGWAEVEPAFTKIWA